MLIIPVLGRVLPSPSVPAQEARPLCGNHNVAGRVVNSGASWRRYGHSRSPYKREIVMLGADGKKRKVVKRLDQGSDEYGELTPV
jgi:hypothetical protein